MSAPQKEIDLSDRLILTPAAFGKFFPLLASHMSIRDDLVNDDRDFIFIQMPRHGTSYVGRVQVVDWSDTSFILEQNFSIRRISTNGKEPDDIIFAMTFMNMGSQQGIGVDKVLFAGGCGLDLAEPVDRGHQQQGLWVAMRYSKFLSDAHTLLGQKPEELPRQTAGMKTLIELLSGDIATIKAHIEQTPIDHLVPNAPVVIPDRLPGITRFADIEKTTLGASPQRSPAGQAQIFNLAAFAKSQSPRAGS